MVGLLLTPLFNLDTERASFYERIQKPRFTAR